MVIAYLLGRGALQVLYGKRKAKDIIWADCIPVGMMLVIGLAEAAHTGAVVLGRSFSDCVMVFLMGLGVLLFAAVLLTVVSLHGSRRSKPTGREKERLRVKRALSPKSDGKSRIVLGFLFGMVLLLQLWPVASGQEIYLTGDMTVETVNSMLTTDTIYEVNPMTGQPYTLGMPLRLRILCLPTLYAILCESLGVSGMTMVWTIIPILTLLGCYGAFYTVSGALFGEDIRKRGIFMLCVAAILWMSDYLYGMDGFGVQHAGFRGVTIRMAILVPYTVGAVLRKKWKLVVLCILAEACIVWTFYGMGVCVLVAVGMVVTGRLADKLPEWINDNRSKKMQQGGEGASE